VSLARAAPSAAVSSAASTLHSQPLPSVDTQESPDGPSNILEEMELAAAKQHSSASASQRRKRWRDEEDAEQGLFADLRSQLQTNQALLERMLEDKSKADSPREPFIRYVSDTLRNASDEHYSYMKDLINDIIHQPQGQRQRNTEGPCSSLGRPAQSMSAPSACTASSQRFSQYSPGFATYSQQQQYYQPQPNYDQCFSLQYGAGGYPHQFPQQQLQDPQQQQQGVTQQQTPRPPRESAESVGRLLAAAMSDQWDLPSETSQRSLTTPTPPTP